MPGHLIAAVGGKPVKLEPFLTPQRSRQSSPFPLITSPTPSSRPFVPAQAGTQGHAR